MTIGKMKHVIQTSGQLYAVIDEVNLIDPAILQPSEKPQIHDLQGILQYLIAKTFKVEPLDSAKLCLHCVGN